MQAYVLSYVNNLSLELSSDDIRVEEVKYILEYLYLHETFYCYKNV